MFPNTWDKDIEVCPLTRFSVKAGSTPGEWKQLVRTKATHLRIPLGNEFALVNPKAKGEARCKNAKLETAHS